MQIRILGCSGGIGGELRTTSFLVDEDILIDAGTGVGNLTLAEMARIRHIFITHSHLDHIAGIPLMVDSIFSQIAQPIVIHASAETVAALRQHIFNWTIWPDFTQLPTAKSGVLRYEVMTPYEVRTLGARQIRMVPVNHVVPGVGYCIETHGRVAAFTGDTTTNETFWAALNDYASVEALIVECAFANQEHDLCRKAHHYCPDLLAADLAKLRHRPPLYLTHLKPGAEGQIERECRELIRDFELRRLFGGDVIPL
ncbi:MAG: 3',5'-cyclic-nucleotide phosphodiesterase [Gammaproteobacteria bacterium]|nr:3',5'-cyclic-nucleotide phosphodiesterase [Gammaproteobacteria bacterium]